MSLISRGIRASGNILPLQVLLHLYLYAINVQLDMSLLPLSCPKLPVPQHGLSHKGLLATAR